MQTTALLRSAIEKSWRLEETWCRLDAKRWNEKLPRSMIIIDVQTDHLISARRPEFIIINNKIKINKNKKINK